MTNSKLNYLEKVKLKAGRLDFSPLVLHKLHPKESESEKILFENNTCTIVVLKL